MKIDAFFRLDQVAISLPSQWRERLKEVTAEAKKTGKLHVLIEPVKRLRTTGPKSQNHRINGFIQQICQWTGEEFQAVKHYCKMRAVRRGYPLKVVNGEVLYSRITGEPMPESEANINIEQAAFLIEEIEQLAAEFGISLIE